MRRNISIALSILLASLFLFQPVVSAETRNTVLAVPSYGTPQSGQIVEGGPWWLVTSMDENRNGIFEYLEEMMERRETLDVFVDYDHTPTSEDVERLEEMGLETTGIVMLGRAIGVRGIESGKIPVVARLPHVVMVEPKMHSFLLSDVATPNAKVQPSKYSPETAWELGYEGGGVNIAIVDTGIDDSHPSLTDKWVAGVEFSHPVADVVRPKDGSFNPDDVNGHGTTCAGIATGTGAPDAKFMGAAPNASLVDVRIGTAVGFAPGEIVRPDEPISIVMDGDGTLAGIEWVGTHSKDAWSSASPENHGIDILSLSWGIALHDPQGGSYSSDGNDIYSRTLDEATMTHGVIVCNAAGNSGPDNEGFDGCAAASHTISVAASDDKESVERQDDVIADYSSRGPRDDNGDGNPYNELRPDVAAPGSNITQAEYDRMGDASGNGYGDRGSGTSYAAPLIAGVVALMLEANENLTPPIAREILRVTSERRGEPTFPDLDPFWNREWGWGLVDGYKAVKLAELTENIEGTNPNIQCHILNRSFLGDNIRVSGMAWSREGNVSRVEYRIGDGGWKDASPGKEGWDSWQIVLSPGALNKGNQTLEVRAVSGDEHSLVGWTVIEGTGITSSTGLLGGGVGYIMAAVAVTVVGYGSWRALKDKKRGDGGALDQRTGTTEEDERNDERGAEGEKVVVGDGSPG